MTVTTKFADQGAVVQVLSFDDEKVTPNLKPAVYSVGFSMMQGFFLTKHSERLNAPEKVYGAVENQVSRIYTSYRNSTKSFGVLFSGDKGSGKTMTAALVANRCLVQMGLPIILVEQSFDADGLTRFIQELGECVLMFDEFGKRFDNSEDDQDALLSLFDGTGSEKRMILLTENNVRTINNYMLNRPGRVHYHFRYGKLDEQIIREFCQDRGIQEPVIEQICLQRDSSNEFSFDVLQAIVDEYELFGGDVSTLSQDLNIEQPYDYTNQMLVIDKIMDTTANAERTIAPRFRGDQIPFPKPKRAPDIIIQELDDPDDCEGFEISVKNIIKREGDTYTFACKCHGHDLIVVGRAVEQEPTWAYY